MFIAKEEYNVEILCVPCMLFVRSVLPGDWRKLECGLVSSHAR